LDLIAVFVLKLALEFVNGVVDEQAVVLEAGLIGSTVVGAAAILVLAPCLILRILSLCLIFHNFAIGVAGADACVDVDSGVGLTLIVAIADIEHAHALIYAEAIQYAHLVFPVAAVGAGIAADSLGVEFVPDLLPHASPHILIQASAVASSVLLFSIRRLDVRGPVAGQDGLVHGCHLIVRIV